VKIGDLSIPGATLQRVIRIKNSI